ncbi:MAG: hypothetical protein HZA04_07020 [Nitrospinae bacterium]|nr:hypothetical protein [Nitrospinota bacterium]
MISEPTSIGSLLDDERGYDDCFCLTYSINYSSAYFIIKNKIKPAIGAGWCHVLADCRKVTEALASDAQLVNSSKLAGLMLLSNQKAKKSFHPKLILLAGKDKITLFLSSGNLTADGLMSDLDVISRVSISTDSKQNGEQKEIIAEAVHYLSGFSGWHKLTRERLAVLVKANPWINSATSNDFLYAGKNRHTLMSQMSIATPIKNLISIEVYSPFYDPAYRALIEFRNRYKGIPITAWVGFDEVQVYSPMVDVLKKKDIAILAASTLNKSMFHAKVYRFIYKDHSLVFWGSANCSYAALMAVGLNEEYLVLTKMSNTQFKLSLFERSDAPDKPPKERIQIKADNDDEKEDHPFNISSAMFGERKIDIVIDGSPKSATIRVFSLLANKIKEAIIDLKYEAAGEYFCLLLGTEKPLAVEIVDKAGRSISNRMPVIDKQSLSTDSRSMWNEVIRETPAVGNLNEWFGQLDLRLKAALKGALLNIVRPPSYSEVGKYDYWSITDSRLWSAGYLKRRATSLNIPQIASLEDDESLPDDKGQLGKRKEVSNEEVADGPVDPNDQYVKEVDYIRRRICKYYELLFNLPQEQNKDLSLTIADIAEHLCVFIGDYLKRKQQLIANNVFDQYLEIYLMLAELVVYSIINADLDKRELSDERVQGRINNYHAVIFLGYFFARYAYVKELDNSGVHVQVESESPECVNALNRASCFTAIFQHYFPLSADSSSILGWFNDTLNVSFVYEGVAHKIFNAINASMNECKVENLPLKEVREGMVYLDYDSQVKMIESCLRGQVQARSIGGETKNIKAEFLMRPRPR